MRTVWPVLERELRVASRRPATWRMRLATGLAGAALAASCFWFFGNVGGGMMEAGAMLFTLLGLACGLWSMLAGCQRTADSIGRERRDGTLGLLFLTDLTGWDVVLGKICAAGCETFYQLMAVVPVLAIPLLLGGVTLSAVALLVLALINGLFLSLSFGLVGSLWARDPRQAVGLAGALLLAVTVFPWAVFIYLVNREQAWAPAEAFPVVLFSPALPFVQLMPSLPVVPPASLAFTAMLVQMLLGFGVLAYTARRVRTIWQEGTGRGWRWWWRNLVDRIRYGPPDVRARRRARLLELGAWVWLSRRERWKKSLPWILVVGLFGIELWIHLSLGFRWVAGEATTLIPLLFHGLIRMWVGAESVQTLAEQRSTGALELLLTTPLGPKEILGQQRRSVVGLLGGPWLALMANDLFLILWLSLNGEAANYRIPWWLHGVAIVTSPLHAYGMRWVATWHVVAGRPANQALGRAMNSVLILPGGVGALVAMAVAMGAQHWDVEEDSRITLFICIWMAVQVVWVGGWGWWHSRRVGNGFRELVTSGRRVREQ